MTWWRRRWRRGRMDDLLERELRFHLDQHAADLVAGGVSPDEARRQARLALGGPEQVKERCRDERKTRRLDDLSQDVRYAVRALRRRPGFAVVALLTLALGSGATTIMFTVVNGVLLAPLPFADPESLLSVDEQTKTIVDYRWGDRWAFSYPNFLDCQREVRSLRMGAFRYNGGTLTGSADPERVDGLQISSDLLPLLGVAPIAGRTFVADDDRPGAAPVIMISSRLWQRRFGGSASAVGAQLVFDATPYTIVGVAPAAFNLRDADVLTPLGQNTLAAPRGASGDSRLGASAARRHARRGAIRARRRRPQPRGAVSAIERRPRLHRGAAAAVGRRRPLHAVAALWRRVAGAAHCVRERGEPAPRARRVARPRDRDARRARCGTRTAGAPASHRKRGARRLRRRARPAARGDLGPSVHRVVARRSAGEQPSAAGVARPAVHARRFARVRVLLRPRAGAPGVGAADGAGAARRRAERRRNEAPPRRVRRCRDRARDGAARERRHARADAAAAVDGRSGRRRAQRVDEPHGRLSLRARRSCTHSRGVAGSDRSRPHRAWRARDRHGRHGADAQREQSSRLLDVASGTRARQQTARARQQRDARLSRRDGHRARPRPLFRRPRSNRQRAGRCDRRGDGEGRVWRRGSDRKTGLDGSRAAAARRRRRRGPCAVLGHRRR